MVGRVIVHGIGSASLSILRNPDNAKDSIVLEKVDDFWEIHGLFEKKVFLGRDIRDAESFFGSLFVAPGAPLSEPLRIMRDVSSIDDVAYTKSAKGVFTVYRIASRYPAANRLYILIDGEKSIYELMGHISDADYEALLSGMALSCVH
jgi:hypothetical protein